MTIDDQDRRDGMAERIKVIRYLMDDFINEVRKSEELELASLLYGDGANIPKGVIFAKQDNNPAPLPLGHHFMAACSKAKRERK